MRNARSVNRRFASGPRTDQTAHAIHIKGSTTSSSPILGVTGTSVISLPPPTTSNWVRPFDPNEQLGSDLKTIAERELWEHHSERTMGLARARIYTCPEKRSWDDWKDFQDAAPAVLSRILGAIQPRLLGQSTSHAPTADKLSTPSTPPTQCKNFDLDLTLLFVADDGERDRRSGAAIAGRWKDEHIDATVR